jgi:hypothetical protein
MSYGLYPQFHWNLGMTARVDLICTGYQASSETLAGRTPISLRVPSCHLRTSTPAEGAMLMSMDIASSSTQVVDLAGPITSNELIFSMRARSRDASRMTALSSARSLMRQSLQMLVTPYAPIRAFANLEAGKSTLQREHTFLASTETSAARFPFRGRAMHDGSTLTSHTSPWRQPSDCSSMIQHTSMFLLHLLTS